MKTISLLKTLHTFFGINKRQAKWIKQFSLAKLIKKTILHLQANIVLSIIIYCYRLRAVIVQFWIFNRSCCKEIKCDLGNFVYKLQQTSLVFRLKNGKITFVIFSLSITLLLILLLFSKHEDGISSYGLLNTDA